MHTSFLVALRKSSGEITGEVRLNGHLQEEKSFRRCTGYVEQFDMQSPQLTIRETVDFSAKLRLDENDAAVTPESMRKVRNSCIFCSSLLVHTLHQTYLHSCCHLLNTTKFVDQTLDMLELTNIQDLQVGSDASGGLSFEQKKRLSIAVELVANPSILFLDEVRIDVAAFYLLLLHLSLLNFALILQPTSGLDARAAAIVMRGLKRIALSGRAVCATIHQPSIAIFSDFDSLLLLKRGGEVVFNGELGEKSQNLIDYFEKYDRTPRIQHGENPATWMVRFFFWLPIVVVLVLFWLYLTLVPSTPQLLQTTPKLTTIGAGSSAADTKPFDYAGNYTQSTLHATALNRIEDIVAGECDSNEVKFSSRFATSTRTQGLAVLKRTMKIYYRTPPYNTIRMIIAVGVALIFSTVYIPFVPPNNESTLNSIMNSIYVSMLFLSVNALNTILSLFEFERNMFYRHKAAGMYGARATGKNQG